jgi:hypothetical protein
MAHDRKEQFCFQKAMVREKDHHNASPGDAKQYFETISGQIKLAPSRFVWNRDEARAECPKKTSSLEVIIAINTKPSFVTILEVRNDGQLTLLMATFLNVVESRGGHEHLCVFTICRGSKGYLLPCRY